MKKLVLTIAALVAMSMSAFAGNTQDIKNLSARLWKSSKTTSSVRSHKAELATVYGGEDVTHRLATSTYIG